MAIKLPFTVNELVASLAVWLESVWPGYTGFPNAFPEPDNDRAIDRAPFFVVYANSGSFGVDAASTRIEIILQIRTSKTDSTDATWAVQTLRNRIDELGRELYKPADGIIHGARPGEMTWEIPAEQPRPVWQARVSIDFEMRSAARDNADFLI